MIPAPFRSRGVLRVLNVAAVGCALAAVVGAGFGRLFDDPGLAAMVTGGSTLLIGTVWATALRWRRTVGASSFRLGWALSMPLAMLNASLACGALFSLGPPGNGPASFFGGALMGATVGVIAWMPALIGTMLCFGVPIAWAQKLAKKGLAGEERGEWIVGLVCVVIGVLGAALAGGRMDKPLAETGTLIMRALGLSGALMGGVATLLAIARERRRRQFVADAEAGKVTGYRVDPTKEGKVLVRVVNQGKGYRVADFEEQVFELDEQGEATRPKTLEA